MAEHGEWNRKGASLSDATAQKEYGVGTEFIIRGINSGDLEYHEGSVWGSPYIKVLRRQLEKYISAQLGDDYLSAVNAKTELRAIKKEAKELRERLVALQQREAEIERLMLVNGPTNVTTGDEGKR
ncbi:MAG TPA: hypothetical protein VIK04_20870 [Solirubrobacteraceae bacterium]